MGKKAKVGDIHEIWLPFKKCLTHEMKGHETPLSDSQLEKTSIDLDIGTNFLDSDSA